MDVKIIPRHTPSITRDKNIQIIIPQCCREGWDSCPHSGKKNIKKKKVNKGL